MKKLTQIIFFLLLLTGLLLPSSTALSQDGELSDLLVGTIWQLHIAEGLGLNSVDNLNDFRNTTMMLYDDAILEFNPDSAHVPGGVEDKDKDFFNAIPLEMERANILEDIDERIALAKEREKQASSDTFLRNVIFVIHAVITDGGDSVNENTPSEPNPVIDKILPVLQKQTQQNATDMFYGHIASGITGSGAFISSNAPSQTYHVDAGLPPSFAHSGISQDDAGNSGNNSGGAINIQKPLQFANSGLFDATVRAFSYAPADGVTASMSRASTVVFRGSNPSANLSLPLGSYVFCYYWDLGTDVDNDGYVDYAHKNSGSVTLSASSSDDTNSAQVVTLNPGSMNNPNGKCGETAPPPAGNAGGLTPQELANQGTHTYQIDCPTEEDFGVEAAVMAFEFVAGGVNVKDEHDDDFYNKINVNTYTWTYTDAFVGTYTFTFTNEGFTLILVLDDINATCTGTRR